MIYVHDLWKSYHGIAILKGLTLTVPEGKTMVILGRSGAGKSVLLRQVIGLEKPDKGYIEVGGVRITHVAPKELCQLQRQFGMLFQSSALFDSMSVGENVAFYLRQHGEIMPTSPYGWRPLTEREIIERVDVALGKVGLSGYQGKMPSELSGGQKRRVALARLIVYKPKVILYDEPTTGLDPITSMQISELIKETNRSLGATAILVTHDIKSALLTGDFFALHHEGAIAVCDERDRFTASPHPLVREFFDKAIIAPRGNTL